MDFLGLSPSELLGTTGVSMVLIAFFLNLIGVMGRRSPTYLLLNIGGGGLGCYASVLIDFFPFVVLEGVWTAVALGGLLLSARQKAVA